RPGLAPRRAAEGAGEPGAAAAEGSPLMRRRAALTLLLPVLLLAGCQGPSAVLDDYGPVSDFALTERSERTVRRDDLAGKVWVAAFIFTNCKGHCVQLGASMAQLQHAFKNEPDVRLVSFSVDPETDTPARLREYAEFKGADAE